MHLHYSMGHTKFTIPLLRYHFQYPTHHADWLGDRPYTGDMTIDHPPTPTIHDLTRSDGTIVLDALLDALHLTSAELAHVLGMSADTLSNTSRLAAQDSQRRLRDFSEILVRVAPWTGSFPQALAWFAAQPLPSFGDQTPADLVREGRAAAVKSYVARIALGGYA